MEAFPAFFPLKGRRVVVAGDGEGVDAKLRLLAGAPATVERLRGREALDPAGYAGAVLAFVASPDADFRRGAAAAARAAHVPVNVVDDQALSDFHTPAVIDRGQVVAAIGTAGAAPIMASLLRAELETKIPEGLGRVAALLQRLQPEIRAAFPDLAQRRSFLRTALDGPAAQAAKDGDTEAGATLLRVAIAAGGAAVGALWLIETGAAADLLTLRAARALATADILAVEDGADPAVLALARRDAVHVPLADAATLAAWVAEGRQVAVVAGAAEISRLAQALTAANVAVRLVLPAVAP